MNFKKIISSFTAFLFSINLIVSAEPVIFNLKKESSSVLEKFKTYRKCSGFLKAYLYGLPVVTSGVIVDDHLSPTDIKKITSTVGDTLMCRPDAPFKNWFGLPRGRELKVEEINDFLTLCKKSNPEAILLCFSFPSVYFTGRYIDRYLKTGSSNVVIDWGKNITIEYVGQGFDGGELTKGKGNSHTSISIPWQISEWPAEFIWDFAAVNNINNEMYSKFRKERIKSLVELGYPQDKVEAAIPNFPVYMSKKIFTDIFKNCVKDLIKCSENFDHKVPTMVLIDLYDQKRHVVEVWNSNL